MILEIKSFRTKVARRIFLLFILCAILPVTILELVSFGHVKNQLITQCNKYLRQESKSLAVSFYERLVSLRSEMKFVVSLYEKSPDKLMEVDSIRLTETISERFSSLALLCDGEQQNIYGAMEKLPRLSSEEWDHLLSGEALLALKESSNIYPDLFMCLSLNRDAPERILLIGKISRSYMLESADRKPSLTELLVMDRSNVILFSSMPDLPSFPNKIFNNMPKSTSGHFEWQHDKDEYLASYSSIFMKPNFFYPEWIIILSELKPDILAPMNNFKLSFLVIIVFTLGLVFFLSKSLIRKSLEPIEVLKNATGQISEGLFGYQVKLESGDEFETLGQDFNKMSLKLKEGQELVVNAAKMSTMGQMAAGVIHEIRQPLSLINGHLQLALLNTSDQNKMESSINTALSAVSRLDNILTRFQPFISRSKDVKEYISLNDVTNQVYELMRYELSKKNIKCVIETDEDLPSIYGDKYNLQQVISNLMINAMHAVEEKEDNNHKIIIKLYSSEEKVYLSIEDNGIGIPEGLREKIYDPFFTTKPSGKGTGLGMAIVQSIIHRYKATIDVKSKLGSGTVFTIAFPQPNNKEV